MELRQSQKYKYYSGGTWSHQVHRERKQNGRCQGLGAEWVVVFVQDRVQHEKSSGDWLHNNTAVLNRNELCT